MDKEKLKRGELKGMDVRGNVRDVREDIMMLEDLGDVKEDVREGVRERDVI